MTSLRYNLKDTKQTLEILGFNVRDTSGGTTMFCIHEFTRDEMWVKKMKNGFLESYLRSLFKPIELRFEFFKSVYLHRNDKDISLPSDQH